MKREYIKYRVYDEKWIKMCGMNEFFIIMLVALNKMILLGPAHRICEFSAAAIAWSYLIIGLYCGLDNLINISIKFVHVTCIIYGQSEKLTGHMSSKWPNIQCQL